MVVFVERSSWSVDEPSAIRLREIVTKPRSEMRKKEVVAMPFAWVEEETSKSGCVEAKEPKTERRAKGVLVPRVTSLPKRLGIVVEAFAMSPCVKATMVEVATMAVFAVEVKGQAKRDEDETLLLNVVQSAELKQPKTEAEAVSQSMSSTVRVNPSPAVRVLVTFPFKYVMPPEKVVVGAEYTTPTWWR